MHGVGTCVSSAAGGERNANASEVARSFWSSHADHRPKLDALHQHVSLIYAE